MHTQIEIQTGEHTSWCKGKSPEFIQEGSISKHDLAIGSPYCCISYLRAKSTGEFYDIGLKHTKTASTHHLTIIRRCKPITYAVETATSIPQ